MIPQCVYMHRGFRLTSACSGQGSMGASLAPRNCTKTKEEEEQSIVLAASEPKRMPAKMSSSLVPAKRFKRAAVEPTMSNPFEAVPFALLLQASKRGFHRNERKEVHINIRSK